MDPAVISVCLVNGLIFLTLLRGIPILWGLRKTFAGAAKTVDEWSDATVAALGSAPQSLLRLRANLQTNQAKLGKGRRWLKWLAGIISVSRRIL